MNWYVIDKDYVNYLRGFDSRVGFVEYGNHLKLHIGILITVSEYRYYVPISSPKPKHENMPNSLSFHKIIDETTGHLYAVVNLNNMIPVPDKFVTQLKYNNISDFRIFKDERDKINYIYLLQIEKKIIDDIAPILKEKAMKLYRKRVENPNAPISLQCCDFSLLEEKSKLYTSN